MWAFPPSWPAALAPNECMLGTLSLHSLLDCCLVSDRNIVELGVDLLLEGIVELHRAVSGGTMLIELYLSEVSLSAPKLLAEIVGWKPWSLLWSNVCDYTSCADFHRLARACSGPAGTKHFAYSMNWPHSIKGAWLIDWERQDDLLDIDQLGTEANEEALLELRPWQTLIMPTSHLRRRLDFYLQQLLGKRWMDHFFSSATDQTADRSFWTKTVLPCSFSFSLGALPLTWTYAY